MPGFNTLASSARIMVAITFHFRPERLKYLFNTVKSLAGFPVRGLDLSVFTNADRPDEIAAIDRLCAPLVLHNTPWPEDGRRFRVVSCPDLPDPRHLGWCHKPMIRDRFLVEPAEHDYFIYLEDDIELSFNNFLYFAHYRQPLAPWRLIPSFLRVEYNYADNQLYNTDQWESSDLCTRPLARLDGLLFGNIANPYSALFILDRPLAEEYVASRSFDMDASRQMQTWDILERAAMGLCFENMLEPFYARFVVPVDPQSLRPPSFCWVYHAPNNYANDPAHPHGKMRLDSLFHISGP